MAVAILAVSRIWSGTMKNEPVSHPVSYFVPVSTERSIVFTDRGRTYRVGVKSGRVAHFDNSVPESME